MSCLNEKTANNQNFLFGENIRICSSSNGKFSHKDLILLQKVMITLKPIFHMWGKELYMDKSVFVTRTLHCFDLFISH